MRQKKYCWRTLAIEGISIAPKTKGADYHLWQILETIVLWHLFSSRIPNADVYKGVILNYTRNPQRRFSFGVGVGVNEDLQRAQQLGVAVLQFMDGVQDQPPPMALVEELGESNVLVRFFGWVDQTTHNFIKVKSEAIRQVKKALDDAGIDMPEPIYRVQLNDQRESRAPAETKRSPESPEVRAKQSLQDTPAGDLSAGDSVDTRSPANGPIPEMRICSIHPLRKSKDRKPAITEIRAALLEERIRDTKNDDEM